MGVRLAAEANDGGLRDGNGLPIPDRKPLSISWAHSRFDCVGHAGVAVHDATNHRVWSRMSRLIACSPPGSTLRIRRRKPLLMGQAPLTDFRVPSVNHHQHRISRDEPFAGAAC